MKPFIFIHTLSILLAVLNRCQSLRSNPIQGYPHKIHRIHHRRDNPNQFKVKSVCFPLDFLEAGDFSLYKKWADLKPHFPGKPIPQELLVGTLPEDETESRLPNFLLRGDSVEHPDFRTSDRKERKKRRFPDHLNQAYHGYSFLRRDECPPTRNGKTRYFCPSKAEGKSHMCIEREQLCDDVPDCPNGEDESNTHCLFHRPMVSQMSELMMHLQTMNAMVSRPLYLIESGSGSVAQNQEKGKEVRIEPLFHSQIKIPKVASDVADDTLDQIQELQDLLDLQSGRKRSGRGFHQSTNRGLKNSHLNLLPSDVEATTTQNPAALAVEDFDGRGKK